MHVFILHCHEEYVGSTVNGVFKDRRNAEAAKQQLNADPDKPSDITYLITEHFVQ